MAEQTTETGYKTLALPDVLGSFDTHAGARCARVGEDGDVLILGHPDEATCWAAFEALTGDDSGPGYYDLRRTQVAWANHSEGCELVDCVCGTQDCDACKAGNHQACESTAHCECAGDYDHDLPAQRCSCECLCDEYSWWVSDVRANGEPATWVSWSYSKARARREAAYARHEAARSERSQA